MRSNCLFYQDDPDFFGELLRDQWIQRFEVFKWL
jgi:hypothetical protein